MTTTTPDERPLTPGTFLGTKFRVERVLGRGGMGIVVAATHLELQQQVAIKILLPEMARDENIVMRFLREARSQVRIQGDHVVRVLDLGTLPHYGPYIVMEMLHGMDLADVLESRKGPLSVEEATDYVLQATEALAQAHSLGIVHRDLKPQNLFLTSGPDGSPLVKVLDFGIAKTSLAPDATHFAGATTGNGLLGSPAYMSPEQIRRPKDVSASSDLWALGVILYELLTNQIPFHATNLGALLTAIATDPPIDIRVLRPHLPEQVAAAIMRCLSKDPAKRPRDVAELAMSIALDASGRERAARIGQIVCRLSSRPPAHLAPPSIPLSEALAATALAESPMTVRHAHLPTIPRPGMLPKDLDVHAVHHAASEEAAATAATVAQAQPDLEWVSTIGKPSAARSIGRTAAMSVLAAALVLLGVVLAARTNILHRAESSPPPPPPPAAHVAAPPAATPTPTPTPIPTPTPTPTTPTPTPAPTPSQTAAASASPSPAAKPALPFFKRGGAPPSSRGTPAAVAPVAPTTAAQPRELDPYDTRK
jgi:eukaryotic-like serine/threonine-protein kinase